MGYPCYPPLLGAIQFLGVFPPVLDPAYQTALFPAASNDWISSHHRVHHAINERYIDKNYGSTFIFWDRMFGTFQEEDEKPIYGITQPVNSYNPVFLVFHEWIDIFRDMRRSVGFRNKLKMLFGRPSVKS